MMSSSGSPSKTKIILPRTRILSLVEERRQDSKSRSRSLRDPLRGNRQTRPTETRTHLRTFPPQIRKRPGRKMVRRRKVQEKSSGDTAWTGPGKEAERQGQSNRDSHITSQQTTFRPD